MTPSQEPSPNISSEDVLKSYMSITKTTNPNVARAALQNTDWNLDLAIESFFDAAPSSSIGSITPTTTMSRTYSNLNIDDSNQSDPLVTHPRPHNHPRRAYEPIRRSSKWIGFFLRIWNGPLRFLSVPVSIIADLTFAFVGIFGRFVGLRLPTISFHWPRPGSSGKPTITDPRRCAERFVRELEEETGGSSSYSTYSRASSSSISLNQSSSSSIGSLRSRRLPDFLLIGYDEAVRKAKEELKVLMVVLVSEEHDDVAPFKRTTLMDHELLRTIQSNNILVWGGDVRDRDACLAARVLDVTTYPTVAFVALQTKRQPIGTMFGDSSSRSSQPVMTVTTRLEGSSTGATSAGSIVNAITGTVVPRTTGLLMRLRADRDRREAERRLREEQDRAYAEAGKRDQERVLAKKAELEAKARKEASEALQIRLAQENKEKKLRTEAMRKKWRAWAARERLTDEPPETQPGVLTIGFRLGNGRRVIRKFLPDEPIESLYVFVEIESAGGKEVVLSQTDGAHDRLDDDYDHEYRFKLSTAMPRRILPLEGSITVKDFGGLDGANVNVEGSIGEDEDSEDSEEE